jgi:hypothetical protein
MVDAVGRDFTSTPFPTAADSHQTRSSQQRPDRKGIAVITGGGPDAYRATLLLASALT